MATNGKLTSKQNRMIGALLASPTIGAACKTVGVGRSTLRRWLQDADFTLALTQAEGETIAGISRSLVGLGDAATEVLRDAMGQDNPTGSRIRAADIVLARLLQLRELVSLEERISRLEAAQDDKN